MRKQTIESLFVNILVFFLGKTSTIHISNFCSEMPLCKVHGLTFLWFGLPGPLLTNLAHQNRTIAIASDFRVDGAKSPEIPQKEGVLGSEIAARNRKSLATFRRTLKSQCSIAFSCLGNRAISGVRDGHRNRKSQKSLRFRCAKLTKKKQGLEGQGGPPGSFKKVEQVSREQVSRNPPGLRSKSSVLRCCRFKRSEKSKKNRSHPKPPIRPE